MEQQQPSAVSFRIRIGLRTLRMRHFLVAVGLLCGIGILAGTLLLLEYDRQSQLRSEEARGQLLASILESHVSRTLSSVDNNLNAIGKMLLPSHRTPPDPGGVDIQALLETIASSSTHLRSLSVLDAGGRVISSSNRHNVGRRLSLAQLGLRSGLGPGMDNGQPLFVRDLYELDDSADAGTEGIFRQRGVYVIPFATLVNVGGTNLTLLALINPAYLFPDHRSGMRSDAGYEALFDYHGIALAATPDAPFTIGSRNPRLPMFDALNNDQEFGYFDHARKGGGEKEDNTLVNFRASRNFPVVAVVGLSETHALARWEKTADNLRLMGMFAALLALLYTGALHRTILDGERNRRELRRAKDAAENANAAKSTFLSTISHEIRTPMHGVLGMTALLRETPLTAQQKEFAQTIDDSGRALMTIINDVLDFSKIEAGQMEIEIVECSLLPLAEGCINTMIGRAASRGLALVSFIDPALPAAVKADGGRIRQVLLNLIDNAVKFTPAGEVVLRVSLIETTGSACRVRFEVSDSGIGIEEQALARLFLPFMQADNSVTRKYGGTGLGLSICKRLLELMGSRIEVQSSPGQGSTFRFDLHLAQVKPAMAIAPLPPAHALVLCAMAGHADALAAYLRAWGMQVHCATDMQQALALAASTAPILALIDIRQPAAMETARRLANDHFGLRLVLMAGEEDQRQDSSAPAFHATLRRPVSQAGLHQAAMFALERRHYMFPPLASTQAPCPAAAPLEINRESALILLVEDNLTNQKVALHQLTRLGYAAHVASNGEEALKALLLHDYALVLMDCQMPLLDGFEATCRIRDRERHSGTHLTIIAMTANATADDRDRCLKAGMDDYLPKPIARETLAALLRHWLVPSLADNTAHDAVISRAVSQTGN